MIDKCTLKDHPRPDWLPDWTDPAACPDHGENAAAWAWEFLRRNPEYQADYAHFIAVPDSILAEDGFTVKSQKWQGSTYVPWADMQFYHAPAGAAHAGETVEAYETRTGAEPVRLETWLLQKWGLIHLNDPASAEPLWLSPDDPMPPFILQQPSHDDDFRQYIEGSIEAQHWIPGRKVFFADWPEKDDGYMCVFAFDVRFPLDGQLVAAKETMVEARLLGDPNAPTDWLSDTDPEPIQEIKGPSTQFHKMRDYLRVYDAAWTVGWDRQLIASTIWPAKGRDSRGDHSGSGTATTAINAAMRFVNGDWHRILTWAELPRNVKK